MGRELENKNDLELIEQIKKGDRRSFSELVKRHQRGLLRLSMRFMKDLDLAEDVVQEAFIKAYEKLNTFEGRASFKSWLYQIAVNTAKNKLRESKMDTTDIEHVHLAVGAIAETTLLQTAVADIIQKEVEGLPFKQKTALVLRIYEDLSFKEIADVMDCPYDTAKANYRHALLKLKMAFEERHDLKNWSVQATGFLTELTQVAEVAE